MSNEFQFAADRIFSDSVTLELLAEAEGGIWPSALWANIEENGFPLALVPEAAGGVGLTWAEIYPVLRSAGYNILPIPMAETMLANYLLVRCGLKPLSGPLSFAAVDGAFEKNSITVTLPSVPWGAQSGYVILVAETRISVLDVAQAHVTSGRNAAGEPRDILSFIGAEPVSSTLLVRGITAGTVQLMGAAIRSAQIVGAMERCTEVAVDYASQRTQFGRPIGKFQALQHRLAQIGEETALADVATLTAFAQFGEEVSPLAVASAKVVASEAAGIAASGAHAILGAIGFTYEHHLHHITRRLWAWRSEYGSDSYWSQSLGQSVCEAGSQRFWPSIVAGQFQSNASVK